MKTNSLYQAYPAIEAIIAETLISVDPFQAVKNQMILVDGKLHIGGGIYQLADYEHIYIIGFGKAVLPMALGTLSVISSQVDAGYLIAKHWESTSIQRLPEVVQVSLGDHPVPGGNTFESTKGLVQFLERVTAKDLVLCLISGGGSALCSTPAAGILVEDIQEMTTQLLACGAEINEINALRKHIDAIKGGGLVEMTKAKHFVTLILSDVIGSPLDVIASGPTVPDQSNFSDVKAIIEKYDLTKKLPSRIIHLIQKGCRGDIEDTPKADHPCFTSVQNVLIGSNYTACLSAKKAAQAAGFHTLLLTTFLRGEARDAGRFLAGLLAEITSSGNPLDRPACIVLGGETTVTLNGTGKGGRNQEMALGALQDLAGVENVLLVTLGTDGEAGPTDAAGAWVTGKTLAKAKELGLDTNRYLQNNDAYHYFEKIDQLIKIGPTGTNVNDIALLFAF